MLKVSDIYYLMIVLVLMISCQTVKTYHRYRKQCAACQTVEGLEEWFAQKMRDPTLSPEVTKIRYQYRLRE